MTGSAAVAEAVATLTGSTRFTGLGLDLGQGRDLPPLTAHVSDDILDLFVAQEPPLRHGGVLASVHDGLGQEGVGGEGQELRTG